MKDLRKPRIFLLCIILFASAAFALKSWYSIIVADKYPIKLVARGLKLNKEQVYLFSTKLLSSPSTDTVIIPVENKHLPDSLCVLFYDNGWKLKLSSKVRDNANNFDHTKNLIARLKGYVTGKETPSETNPLYPWCCRQSSYETFFSKGSIIAENYLVDEGVKFNYYSGYPIDRLSIQLDTIGDDFYLKTNLGYLRGEFPLSKGKKQPC
jgi:hypothetical protein